MQMSEERFLGLPAVETDLTSTIWNKTSSSAKKYKRTIPIDVEDEMFEAVRALAYDPRLPFQGNVSSFGRHALAWAIESLRLYMSVENDMMWRRLLAAQRRATTEWYVVKIEELLDQQVELLREWTAAEEWGAVLYDLAAAASDIAAYDRPEFKRRAARGWLTHKGVKALLGQWDTTMADQEPETWHQVLEIFTFFEELARV